jgi:dipeptidyl aminopeptidase/acylaminoacyl peptidase
MKKVLLLIPVALVIGIFIGESFSKEKVINLTPIKTPTPTPLDKYTIDNLSKAEIKKSFIELGELLTQNKDFNSYLFTMNFDPTLSSNEEKKVTGLINIPNGPGPFPLIVMIRGYVDQKIYQTGVGTKRDGEFFAAKGFITIAPDFLGYAGSNSESGDIFESRFQTYTTILSLLKAVSDPSFAQATEGKWDGKNIFIWAHSNGGQIALTTLVITQANYPTVLWAPVTKPFPYNVLYYTDESDDGGKLIRRELAKFEDLYDTNLYSFTNYLDRIKAPIILHQGTADDAVPVSWSDSFVKILKSLNIDITYELHPNADHNLMPSWDEAIGEDLEFFQKNLR